MNGLHRRFLRSKLAGRKSVDATWVGMTDMIWGGFSVSTALYSVSALLSVWVAYDRTVAVERFFHLLMGIVLVFVLLWQSRRDGMSVLYHLCRACTVLAAGVSFYLLLFHDWTTGEQIDFAPFQSVALALEHFRPQLIQPPDLHENLVANILVLLLPLCFGSIILAPQQSARWMRHGVYGALVLSGAALAMTFSRGAWLGLGIGAIVALYLYWRTGSGHQSTWCTWGDRLIAGGTALLFLLVALLITPSIAHKVQSLLPVGSTPATHLSLWQDTLSLIRDYRYTGSGLGVSTMVFSTYYFLVHVPYLHHAHNLLLQIGVEQGLPGIIAFIGLVGAAALSLSKALRSGDATMRKASAIGIATLSAMMVHGLTEAELYASPFVLLTFLPLGFALSLLQMASKNQWRPLPRSAYSIGGVYSTWQISQRSVTGIALVDRILSSITKREAIRWVAGAAPVLFMLALLFLTPGASAAVRANWGAVMQTRAELAAYSWPQLPIQDVLRRMEVVDLDHAAAEFRSALKLNPGNVTANRRLGQVALSMGQYDVAHRRLEIAFALSPGDQTARQLLGEVYAIQGDVEHSATLWRLIPTNFYERLHMRKWWYEYIDAEQEAKWVTEAIAQVEAK